MLQEHPFFLKSFDFLNIFVKYPVIYMITLCPQFGKVTSTEAVHLLSGSSGSR